MMQKDASRPLRKGWTTGTCATAAIGAAYQALLSGRFPDPVIVALPRGGTTALPLARHSLEGTRAVAGIIKDAGDDPDVTHGAEIIAAVTLATPGTGVWLKAGQGIGTVTLPGLPVGVGEPAINPGPRGMIERAVRAIADQFDAPGDIVATLSIPEGEALAAKTLNGRLGIQGGLSILGTTGVVVPFSCAAWIHSIHRGIDVARATNIDHIAAATGSTSEAAVKEMLRLPDVALIDMGDFVGGTLKYLRCHPVPRLTLAGGFAKIVKFSQGNLFLHSSKSVVDRAALADTLAALGGNWLMIEAARQANTAAQVLTLAEDANLPLGNAIAGEAKLRANALLSEAVAVDVLVFDRRGRLVGSAEADA